MNNLHNTTDSIHLKINVNIYSYAGIDKGKWQNNKTGPANDINSDSNNNQRQRKEVQNKRIAAAARKNQINNYNRT